MAKYNLHWLFSFMLMVGFVLAIRVYSPRDAYYATCFVLPLYFSLFARLGLNASHGISVATLFIGAIFVGSFMRAARTYYFTFVSPGNSTYSADTTGIGISAAIGGALGVYVGVLLVVMYLVIASILDWRKQGRLDATDDVDS